MQKCDIIKPISALKRFRTEDKMYLSIDEIKSITVGAVRSALEADGLHFYKCTEKQTAAWYTQRKLMGERSVGSTGVRLDFHTDSSFFELGLAAGRSFDVYVDGEFSERFEFNGLQNVIRMSLDTDKRERRVTVYFPNYGDGGAIRYLILEDDATLSRHRFNKKILFIGDSIIAGYDASRDGLSLAHRVSRHFDAESVIHGIPGGYFHEDCFDTVGIDPDAVIVAFGTNDFSHYKSTDLLRNHAEKYFELLKREYYDKKLFFISPVWRVDHDRRQNMGSFDDCRRTVIECGEKYGFMHVDGYSMIAADPEYFSSEGVHPNDKGFEMYSNNLIKALEQYI